MQKRRQNLLKFCNKIGCDTIVAFEPENLFYMTSFWGEVIGVLDKNGATIVSPELEMGRAKEESTDCKIVKSERGKGALSTLVGLLKGKKVCTDSNNYDVIKTLKKSIPSVKSTTDPFYRVREVKDSGEINILKKASSILDEMYELCVDEIKIGKSESELQTILMSYAMEKEAFATGYKSTLNPLIIAGGPNSALPHAQ
ncbi:MAG: aminopeptidase P family protein, partial [Thaumarchaeota archaeon]